MRSQSSEELFFKIYEAPAKKTAALFVKVKRWSMDIMKRLSHTALEEARCKEAHLAAV